MVLQGSRSIIQSNYPTWSYQESNRMSNGPRTYAEKHPTKYSPAEHQRTIRLKRLTAWHAVGSFGSQAPFLICSFGAIA
jgi:hypothetical protein